MAGKIKKSDFHALTIKANSGRLAVLQSEVRICAAFDPATTPQDGRPQFEIFQGVWDTGASGSVITQRVVDRCGLRPYTMKNVQGAYGPAAARDAYLVNVGLPQGVAVSDVTVVWGEMGVDVLIGMDIITLGDFAITNEGNITTFSFRIPSLHTIDYVRQADQIRAAKVARMPLPGSQVSPSRRRRGR